MSDMSDEDEAAREQAAFEARILANPYPDDRFGWYALLGAFPLVKRVSHLEDEIGAIENAFDGSIDRIRALAWLPDRVWMDARRYERLRCIAYRQETGRLRESPEDKPEKAFRIHERVRMWLGDHSTMSNEVKYEAIFAGGGGEFLNFDRPDKNFRDECRTVLESLVTLSFSAFEILAGDLWETAVNLRPQEALERFAESQQGQNEKQISLSTLMHYRFDLSNNMGTVLRDTEKVDFNSLRGIQAAYKRVMGKEVGNLIVSEPYLVLLEAVRNLVAHRGGVVDVRFASKGRDWSPPFNSLAIGATVPLNGKIVANFIEAVRKTADRLCIHMREWIATADG